MGIEPDDSGADASEGLDIRVGSQTYRVADPASITQLLGEVQEGVEGAWDRVYALLYAELRQVAVALIRRQYRGQTMSPTSLVSETWIRLSGAELGARDKSHLVTLIVRAMRFVLVDQARRIRAGKRGEGVQVMSLEDSVDVGEDDRFEQFLVLDKALTGLAEVDPRMARVVEMRYFGGMTLPEIAEALGITERTAGRDWRKARAFLFSVLADSEDARLP